jgi:hypothetical protein
MFWLWLFIFILEFVFNFGVLYTPILYLEIGVYKLIVAFFINCGKLGQPTWFYIPLSNKLIKLYLNRIIFFLFFLSF